MVPGATPYPGAIPAIGGVPVMPAASPMPGQPVQSVYNPTPPVRQATKKAIGCIGVISGVLGLLTLASGLALVLVH
jgi:hypothetical protein